MVRTRMRTRDAIAVGACILASLAAGLVFGTRSGHEAAGPIGAVVLFLVLVWDIRLAVPVLIVTLPFGPKFSMGFGNLYLSTAVLIVAYAAWIARMAAKDNGFSLKYNGVVLALLGLIVAFALSSLQNYKFLLSDRPAFLKFIQFLMYTGIFVLVCQMEFSRNHIRNLFILIILGGIVQGFIGAMQWITRPGFYVAGTFGGQHNIFSSYMAFMTLLVLGIALEVRRQAVRFAGLIAVCVMLYSIVFSFSRTAYVSLLVSFSVFAFLPIARVKRIVIPMASAAATAAALIIVPVSVAERMRDIVLTATGEYVALSFRYRLKMWQDAFKDFTESPIIGKGASIYGLRDNFFVKAGAEAGALGLGVFLVLVYLILRASWRSVADPPEDDFMRGIVIGFFPAAVGSLIVFNLAGDFITIHRFIGVFWIALALMLHYCSAEGSLSNGTQEATEGPLR